MHVCVRHMRTCTCVCVCVFVCARMRVCVQCAGVTYCTHLERHEVTFVCVCVCGVQVSNTVPTWRGMRSLLLATRRDRPFTTQDSVPGPSPHSALKISASSSVHPACLGCEAPDAKGSAWMCAWAVMWQSDLMGACACVCVCVCVYVYVCVLRVCVAALVSIYVYMC